MPKPITLPTKNGVTKKSLWNGPLIDGITYSLLCKWLCCRERFRLQVVEGLREDIGFSHHMEYGTLWHHCEEAHGGGKPWQPALEAYYQELLTDHPANDKEVTKWFLLCQMQFPIYIKYWAHHETTLGCKPLFEEKAFRIPYAPSPGWQYPVILRGKIDRAFTRNGFVWLQENKTKGEIDQEGISTTIDQNMQTMMYHIALRYIFDTPPGLGDLASRKIAGTLYNVVRRPLSDRFAPRQKKTETLKAFVARVGEQISAEPHKHFFRWLVPVAERHLERFKRDSFNPIIRQLVTWWQSIQADPFHPEKSEYHYRFPFGVYHSMERGFRGDYFRLLTTGSKAGLNKIDNLFPEL